LEHILKRLPEIKGKDVKLLEEKILEEILKERVTEDEFIRELVEDINTAVVEEVIHAYGDAGHREAFLIEYKNKEDEERILQILKNQNIKSFFRIECYRRFDEKHIFRRGEIYLILKDLNLEKNIMKKSKI
jgi:hypothetical protein